MTILSDERPEAGRLNKKCSETHVVYILDSGIHYKTLNWGRFVLILLKFPVKCFEALWLWGILSEIQSAPQSDSFAIKSLPKPLKCGEFDNML